MRVFHDKFGHGEVADIEGNFGDCFAYELAREHGCALLFVGGDFALTDLEAALA